MDLESNEREKKKKLEVKSKNFQFLHLSVISKAFHTDTLKGNPFQYLLM